MSLPRVRFTLRGMMVLVAFTAVGLAIVEEFRDGSPPRFVVRGIPGRIARLRPGMTPEQAYEVLGLDRTWLLGGTSAIHGYAIGMHGECFEHYTVRTASILLVFSDHLSRERRLIGATSSSGPEKIAEMPGSR